MPGGLFNFLGALESSKTHNVSPKKADTGLRRYLRDVWLAKGDVVGS